MGITIVFSGKILILDVIFIPKTIIAIYKAAAKAYRNGFFIMSIIAERDILST